MGRPAPAEPDKIAEITPAPYPHGTKHTMKGRTMAETSSHRAPHFRWPPPSRTGINRRKITPTPYDRILPGPHLFDRHGLLQPQKTIPVRYNSMYYSMYHTLGAVAVLSFYHFILFSEWLAPYFCFISLAAFRVVATTGSPFFVWTTELI